MAMIEVQFTIKSEVKTVNVDFFSEDYCFINHLKRCVLAQIRGNVQKNLVLDLVNKGIFTVVKDQKTVYSYLETPEIVNNNPINILTVANNQELDSPYVIERYYTSNNIDEICEKIDLLEDQSSRLHIRLQHLLGLEEDILNKKIQAM